MVNPTTGPFTTSSSDTLSSNFQRKYKQAKPIDRPLLYYSERMKTASYSGSLGNLPSTTAVRSTYFGPSYVFVAAQLAAYERLKSQISSQAQLGVGLAELAQSTSMISARVLQLLRFTNQVRKFQFSSAAQTLHMSFLPKGVSRRKSLGNNWLEYSFGWRPLIQDVYSAVDVLQNPILSVFPKGRGVSKYQHLETTGSKATWQTTGYTEIRGKQDILCETGAKVEISNPNLYLANNLGLVNPSVVLWELIPFSFVVDWFTTVGAFLSSGTDFLGLSVTGAWNTTYTKLVRYDETRNPFWAQPINMRWSLAGRVNRQLGLASVPITVRPFNIPNWRRAANAISLLLQRF
jgi:hypothetical protein